MSALICYSKDTNDVIEPELSSSRFSSVTSSPGGMVPKVDPLNERFRTLSPLKWMSILGGLGAVSFLAFVLCLGFGTERISFFQVAIL